MFLFFPFFSFFLVVSYASRMIVRFRNMKAPAYFFLSISLSLSFSMTLETGAPTFLKTRTTHDVNSAFAIWLAIKLPTSVSLHNVPLFSDDFVDREERRDEFEDWLFFARYKDRSYSARRSKFDSIERISLFFLKDTQQINKANLAYFYFKKIQFTNPEQIMILTYHWKCIINFWLRSCREKNNFEYSRINCVKCYLIKKLNINH